MSAGICQLMMIVMLYTHFALLPTYNGPTFLQRLSHYSTTKNIEHKRTYAGCIRQSGFRHFVVKQTEFMGVLDTLVLGRDQVSKRQGAITAVRRRFSYSVEVGSRTAGFRIHDCIIYVSMDM